MPFWESGLPCCGTPGFSIPEGPTRGVTGFGTPPVTLGPVCVGVVPPGLMGLGAVLAVLGCVTCEKAGALTQIIANANSAVFPMVFPLLSELKRKTDRRELVFPKTPRALILCLDRGEPPGGRGGLWSLLEFISATPGFPSEQFRPKGVGSWKLKI